MAEKIPSRQELAREDTWAIEDLYETDEAWLSDLEKLKALGADIEIVDFPDDNDGAEKIISVC